MKTPSEQAKNHHPLYGQEAMVISSGTAGQKTGEIVGYTFLRPSCIIEFAVAQLSNPLSDYKRSSREEL
jgi:hypothetical protein